LLKLADPAAFDTRTDVTDEPEAEMITAKPEPIASTSAAAAFRQQFQVFDPQPTPSTFPLWKVGRMSDQAKELFKGGIQIEEEIQIAFDESARLGIDLQDALRSLVNKRKFTLDILQGQQERLEHFIAHGVDIPYPNPPWVPPQEEEEAQEGMTETTTWSYDRAEGTSENSTSGLDATSAEEMQNYLREAYARGEPGITKCESGKYVAFRYDTTEEGSETDQDQMLDSNSSKSHLQGKCSLDANANVEHSA